MVEASSLRIEAKRRGQAAICPDCGQRSHSVHSRYTRSPADLPVAGRSVQLRLHVRRFRCLNGACPRCTFAEPFPELTLPHAQGTTRLRQAQSKVGVSVGGEGGSRLLASLHMPTSPDTILRLLRGMVVPERPTPRVLGVDDWSFRRGKRFGTILVDLEKHCVVDLLPDRSGDTLADWLKQHPGVEIISRDRSGEYARGATEGAPQARQVVDRWHLLKNLGDTLQQWLERHRNYLVEPTEVAGTQADPDRRVSYGSIPSSQRAGNSYECALLKKVENRERRLELYQQAKDLKDQGFSIRAIALKLSRGRSTIRRLLDQEGERKDRANQLEPFLPYLQQRFQAGMVNRMQLYREILSQGFTGSYATIYSYFAARDAGLEDAFSRSSAVANKPKQQRYRPSEGRRLFSQPPSELKPHDHTHLKCLFDRLAEAKPCYELVQEFLALFRHRDEQSIQAFNCWLQKAQTCPVVELRRFASRLLPDKPAVEAALTLPWSNGPVEGEVTKLKLIKRSMYGRAKFDLLRQRVLLA